MALLPALHRVWVRPMNLGATRAGGVDPEPVCLPLILRRLSPQGRMLEPRIDASWVWPAEPRKTHTTSHNKAHSGSLEVKRETPQDSRSGICLVYS